MNVLYLTVLENTERNNIHENQIFALRSTDINYKFLFFSPFFILNRTHLKINRNSFHKSADCREFKIPIFSYNFYLHVILLPYLLLCVLPILIYCIARYKPRIVHTRNLLSTFVAVIAKKISRNDFCIVSDPRSVYPEEGVIIKRWKYNRFNYRMWKKIEAWTFKNSDACLGLSELFKDYLMQYNRKSYFIPAVVNELNVFDGRQRKMLRKKLGIADSDCVLIYVGSIGLWHDVNTLIQIINLFALKNKNFKIIALSSSLELKHKIMNNFGEKVLFCGTVPPIKVREYLTASDFGIIPGSAKCGYAYELLYETMIASKAEEYLCTGLPIIVNERIVNLKQYIERNNWGIVYSGEKKSFIGNWEYLEKERKEISSEALNLFSVNVVKMQLKELYKNLLNLNNEFVNK